jgi:hypothetical protein
VDKTADSAMLGTSEEALVPGQCYAFLITNEDIRKSNSFMAIVGLHALALSQSEGQPFQAVRMIRSSSPSPSSRSHHGWEVIYSAPSPSSNTLEAALSDFLTLLNDKGSQSTVGCWTTGDKIRFELENTHRTWTVFDCGVV